MRKALLCAVVVLLAIPTLGQEGPIAGGAKIEVVQFLGLTADQVAQWDGLIATREQTVPGLREQLKGVEEQIRGLLGQPTPDPAAIGTLVIQADGLKDQIEEANKAYLDGFEGLLGPDQLAKLNFMRRAQKAVPLLPAFRLFGLVPPLPHPLL